MTAPDGATPDWVAAVNRGDVPPISEAAAAPFTLDDLVGRVAAARAEPTDVVAAALDDDTRAALAVLLPALEAEACLSVLGRWITHRFLERLLTQRVALEAYEQADPGVRDERVTEPWFVVGPPRSGTTALYAMLAADPRLRAPTGWELLRPVPPPAHSGDVTARIALADAELRTPHLVSGGMDAIHVYAARAPKECLSAMSFAFRSEEFVARYAVPSYAGWLAAADPAPAYAAHRRVLRVLQRGATPERRWVLKSPVHLHALPTLLATYPDARIVVTHRDPAAFLASVSSLIVTLRSVHSDHVDAVAVGRYHLDRYADSLDRLVDRFDDGTLDPARIVWVRHADLVADPAAVLRRVYGHGAVDLPDALLTALTAADQGTAEAGPHRYDAATFGLDPAEISTRFARSTARITELAAS